MVRPIGCGQALAASRATRSRTADPKIKHVSDTALWAAAFVLLSMLASSQAYAGFDHELPLDQSGIWARQYQTGLQDGVIALELAGGAFSRRFSSPVHFALYALMFVIPIFGVVTFIYHGRIFHFGLFDVNFGIRKNPAIFEPTEDIHGYLAYALFALAGLHALAALWHHFVLHDGVLKRIWPA